MTQEEKDKVFEELERLEDCYPNFAESIRDNAYCEAIRECKRIIGCLPTSEPTFTYTYFGQKMVLVCDEQHELKAKYNLTQLGVDSYEQLKAIHESAGIPTSMQYEEIPTELNFKLDSKKQKAFEDEIRQMAKHSILDAMRAYQAEYRVSTRKAWGEVKRIMEED